MLCNDDAGVLVREIDERRYQGRRPLVVELRERFVEHQQAGSHRENAGDRKPLALAARERRNRAAPEMRDPSTFERLADPAEHQRRRCPDVLEPERNITLDARIHGLQFRILKHEPDTGGEHPRRRGDHVVAAHLGET